MSNLIFLNGAGSSGKTSISRAIQYLSNEPWLAFGVDTFIEMTSYPTTGKSKGDYLSFVSGRNKNGPTTRVELKEKGKMLFKCMPEFANLLLNEGNNISIDDVLLDDEQLKNYLNRLSSSHIIYFVGVYCKLNIMQEREILRRNRAIGLSNDQFKRVHNGLREYDITVDTSNSSIFEAAKKILKYTAKVSKPEGFYNMRKHIFDDKK